MLGQNDLYWKIVVFVLHPRDILHPARFLMSHKNIFCSFFKIYRCKFSFFFLFLQMHLLTTQVVASIPLTSNKNRIMPILMGHPFITVNPVGGIKKNTTEFSKTLALNLSSRRWQHWQSPIKRFENHSVFEHGKSQTVPQTNTIRKQKVLEEDVRSFDVLVIGMEWQG